MPLKQWRIVNNSDCLVCKEKENYKHRYLDCKYNKQYWQEVKKITTNLYIGDHVFNLESLVFATKLWWNSPWMAPFQNCVRWSRPLTKMAAQLYLV
jgi:hypothetical protein